MGLIGKEYLTIKRKTGGAYDSNGRWVEGGEVTIHENKTSTITPLSGNELLLLAEGERERQPLNLFTTLEGIELKDIVIRAKDSKRYVIMKIEDWGCPTCTLRHIKATMLLEEGQ